MFNLKVKVINFYMKLTDKIIRSSQEYKTPFLIVNPEVIRENCRRIQKSFGDVQVYYAIKANPDLRILEIIRDMGCGFEVASTKELDLVLKIGVNPSLIISSHPIKTPEFVELAYENKIRLFVFDSKTEIDKISKFAPKSKVCARLNVSNIGSEWPLAEKFGLELEKIIPLLEYANKKGLIPYGVTFHVGSQCVKKSNWIDALKKSSRVFELATKKGINLKLVNLGGGLPVKHTHEIPTIEEIGQIVIKAVENLFKDDIEITIEPGRAIVGNAAILVTSIIGKAGRKNKNWLYLDAGVFQGLMETVGGIEYVVKVRKSGSNLQKYMLAGPTCDSFDKMFSCYLPEDLEVGERVYVMDAGAYTTAYASNFDGFEIPKVYFLE